MSTAEAASIDPYEQLSDNFVQNSYPAYEKLRAEAPIYKNPNAERWFFSRYCSALGGGIHYCLGAALARMEAEVALNKLLQRFPGIKLPGGRPSYRDSAGLRGLQALTVDLF